MVESPIEINHNTSPIASVIWLHGLGADGQDFAPVVGMLDLPDFRFILPHAPYRKVTINNGYEMRAWYDLYGLEAGCPEDATGIRESQTYIESLIERELSRGIPSHKIILAGFSQGGAIVLHTGLRYPKKLAGIVALSTYLPLNAALSVEKSAANQNTPIFMAHGVHDDVISLATCQDSLTLLQAENYQVDWHEYPMAHSVSIDEIDEIRTFLLSIIE
jgi:phospholipase/carboxylesterase